MSDSHNSRALSNTQISPLPVHDVSAPVSGLSIDRKTHSTEGSFDAAPDIQAGQHRQASGLDTSSTVRRGNNQARLSGGASARYNYISHRLDWANEAGTSKSFNHLLSASDVPIVNTALRDAFELYAPSAASCRVNRCRVKTVTRMQSAMAAIRAKREVSGARLMLSPC